MFTTDNFNCSLLNDTWAMKQLAENTTVDTDIVGLGVRLFRMQ